ncbi:MAG: HesA/MoeB/ThiF family protein [Spirochaetia bacterium]|nr:HesA/MoeB/ThiF family protein [Spirochaetia bacterium]
MLSNSEIARYSRQILLLGKNSQIKLKNSRALVLGAGGIGSALLPYLVSSGIGYIRLVDPDVVEESNLSRQILYNAEHIGALKGAVAAEYLTSLNPQTEVDWISGRFSNENYNSYVDSMDIILEGTDDIQCKFLVSDISIKKNIPAIIGSIGNVQGHVFPIAAKTGHACYRCLFEAPPVNEVIPTCATEGILSPLPGIIGSMMAYLAVDLLSGNNFLKKIYLMEKGGWRTISLSQNPHCKCCL